MQELMRSLAREQPLIKAALDRHVADLPANARPVAAHVLDAGGKRLRPFLTLHTGRALGCDDPRLYTLGAAIEMLHAATLLHDDILDNASLRRGEPAAHTLYDPAMVILSGDAMLAKALLMVAELEDARIIRCLSQAVMETAAGEIAEFVHLRNPNLSQDDYLDMVRGKTAWMLRAACELGALSAHADQTLVEAAASFGMELGIAFQMVDDALDFSPSEKTGKPWGGDLKEGKLTPPLFLYLAGLAPEEADLFKRRFAANELDAAELDAVSREVCQQGHALAARKIAQAHVAAASEALYQFPASPERIVLEQMLCYIQTREE